MLGALSSGTIKNEWLKVVFRVAQGDYGLLGNFSLLSIVSIIVEPQAADDRFLANLVDVN